MLMDQPHTSFLKLIKNIGQEEMAGSETRTINLLFHHHKMITIVFGMFNEIKYSGNVSTNIKTG